MKAVAAVLAVLIVCGAGAGNNLDSLLKREKQVEGKEKVEVLNGLAKEYFFRQPDISLEYGQKALALACKLGYTEGTMYALKNIGIAYYFTAYYDKALYYYTEALKIAQENHNRRAEADCMNNIAMIYVNLEEYDTALHYYRDALKIFEEINDQRGKAVSLNNIGEINYKKGDYTEALDYYVKSLDKFRKMDDRFGYSSAVNSVGDAYGKLENWDKALEYYGKALTIARYYEDKFNEANTLINMGIIYTNTEKYDKANKYLQEGSTLAVNNNLRELIKNSYLGLSNLRKKKGDYKSALDYYQKYESIKDSIATESAMKRIREFQARYDLAARNSEITELKHQETKQRMHRIILYIGLTFFFVTSLVLYLINRAKHRANVELAKALNEVKTLRGLLPICSNCKKIRKEDGSWSQLEAYLRENSQAEFSHGVCPDCAAELYPDFFKK